MVRFIFKIILDNVSVSLPWPAAKASTELKRGPLPGAKNGIFHGLSGYFNFLVVFNLSRGALVGLLLRIALVVVLHCSFGLLMFGNNS